MEDLTSLIDQKHSIDNIYLDFKKAFDSVFHERLKIKLKSYGLIGNILKWISNFLKDRKQKVVVNGEESDLVDVSSGIPQGSVLGPLLFVIFINDLPDNLSCSCKMFADATKLFDCSLNSGKLQNDLLKLFRWAEEWQLYFNAGKFKVLHIGKKNRRFQYYTDDNQSEMLTVTSGEKDVGVTFDNDLHFDTHKNNCCSKANKVLGIISRSFDNLNCDIITNLFIALNALTPGIRQLCLEPYF